MWCAYCMQFYWFECMKRYCASAPRRHGTRWMYPVNDIRIFGYERVGWGNRGINFDRFQLQLWATNFV
ncbi:hypothetical protein DPMN_176893 [Dreissena polymorpha]|uniref:Uncharacterized protein n=1 Tax=Dreissena polymorpha TaxID=45954 RepID=A0A9D4IIH8_DREPO|nr:hypothetical protein DPMN_176893 [Dreissena polymorpha]